jgi:hypothetical protein
MFLEVEERGGEDASAKRAFEIKSGRFTVEIFEKGV